MDIFYYTRSSFEYERLPMCKSECVALQLAKVGMFV
jgi:hypothetical protein